MQNIVFLNVHGTFTKNIQQVLVHQKYSINTKTQKLNSVHKAIKSKINS